MPMLSNPHVCAAHHTPRILTHTHPQVVPICIKAAFLSCGQNCAGGERFLVHTSIYNKFVEQVLPLVAAIRQGPALCGSIQDAGAMCMPGERPAAAVGS